MICKRNVIYLAIAAYHLTAKYDNQLGPRMFKYFYSLDAFRQIIVIIDILMQLAWEFVINSMHFLASTLDRFRARLGACQLAQHSSKKIPLSVLKGRKMKLIGKVKLFASFLENGSDGIE